MGHEQETATIDARGRLVVPSAWREALGLRPGDSALLEFTGTELRVVSAARQRAALVAGLRGSVRGPGSVDDLIAERRAEAAREATEA